MCVVLQEDRIGGNRISPAAILHGVPPMETFEAVEHPSEPVDVDQPARCPPPERGITQVLANIAESLLVDPTPSNAESLLVDPASSIAQFLVVDPTPSIAESLLVGPAPESIRQQLLRLVLCLPGWIEVEGDGGATARARREWDAAPAGPQQSA